MCLGWWRNRWSAGLIDSSLAGMLIDSILRGRGMENSMIFEQGCWTFRRTRIDGKFVIALFGSRKFILAERPNVITTFQLFYRDSNFTYNRFFFEIISYHASARARVRASVYSHPDYLSFVFRYIRFAFYASLTLLRIKQVRFYVNWIA